MLSKEQRLLSNAKGRGLERPVPESLSSQPSLPTASPICHQAGQPSFAMLLLLPLPTLSQRRERKGEGAVKEEGEDSSHTHKEEDLITRTNIHIFSFCSFLNTQFPLGSGLLSTSCESSMDYAIQNHSLLSIARPPTFLTKGLS